MRVPLLDLCAQYEKLKAPIDDAVSRVLRSGRYVLGPEVSAFETELGDYLKGDGEPLKVVAVSSGTDALLASAMALGVGLGCRMEEPASAPHRTEVVTTAYSFFATPETISRLGGYPVFADIEEDGFNASVGDMLSKVSPRTRAILPVHLFGQRMPVEPLVQSGLPVIEDAAQTLVPGIGTATRCATLSFFPTKNLGAAGDAGAIVTRDAALHEALVNIRQHGSKPKYVHALWGGNFRMDPLQAAILRVKLKHLRAWHEQRRAYAADYHAGLAELTRRLPLRLPPHPQSAPEHVYHHFVIRAPRRDALRAFLGERGVETEVYYPLPLHLQPCYAQLGYRAGSCPRAEAAAQEALALPVHADLTSAQVSYVAECIHAFYQS
jgi:dTDP-4-amino-4,6-dideoxygalactose transaminase